MEINKKFIRPALWITGLSLALSIGCTRKSNTERSAEVRNDAAEDITDIQRDSAESMAERREEVGEVNREAREDIAEIHQEGEEDTRDAFGRSMSERLSVLDERIDALEDNVDDKADTASAALAPRIADVKAKREAAATQLDNVKGADETSWRNMRTGLTQAFNDLENALRTAEEAVVAH